MKDVSLPRLGRTGVQGRRPSQEREQHRQRQRCDTVGLCGKPCVAGAQGRRAAEGEGCRGMEALWVGSGESMEHVQWTSDCIRVVLQKALSVPVWKTDQRRVIYNLGLPLSHGGRRVCSIVLIALAFKRHIKIFGDIFHKDYINIILILFLCSEKLVWNKHFLYIFLNSGKKE